MGRAWRIEYEDALYPVVSHGNRQKVIFTIDEWIKFFRQKKWSFCFFIFLNKPMFVRTTALAGKRHAIGVPIACFTMPLAPISTSAAFFTMPSAAVLYDFVPTK